MLDLASLRLRAWYTDQHAPMFHADARPRTIEIALTTITHWERITGDPPLTKISQLTVAEFRAGLHGAAATRAKHCRTLNALLAKLGPPGPHNRDALGLLPAVPWCKPPRVPVRTRAIPADDAIDQFINVAPPALQLLAVTAALTGSRQTAIRHVRATHVDARNQLIQFAADHDKTGHDRTKPVPAVLIDWWRALGHHADEWRTARTSFCRRWRKYALRANTPHVTPHALKRWWAARLVRAGASPWCVRFALDHAQRDVTGLHYLQPFDELAGLVDRIPLPASFTQELAKNAQTPPPHAAGTSRNHPGTT